VEAIQTILAICGGISILGGAGAVIFKVVKPAIIVGKRLSELEEKSKLDYKSLQDMAEANKAMCSALLAILDHQIYGNHIEELEKAKEKIREYLIER
jgi:hypothetical protein